MVLSVVHVVSPQPRGDTGGAQLHVADLAAAQVGVGTVTPRVVELGAKGYAASLAALGVDAVTLDRPYAVEAVRRLSGLLACGPVDLVHSHGYDADFLAGLAGLAGRSRPAWVATVHGFVTAGVVSRAKTAANRRLLRHGPAAVIA
ncbi:MAG TPA: glycosyltransferase, partial [Acidimicrobiales bacterium]